MKSNENINKWIEIGKNNKFEIKIGKFFEKMLSETNFNSIIYYLVCIYMFLVELQKHLSLIQSYILDQNTNILFPSIQYLLEFLLLEKYCCGYSRNFSLIFYTFFLGIQLFIVFYLFFLFFFHGNHYFNIPNKLLQLFNNIICLLLLVFPYSFNFLNLTLLFNLKINDSLTLTIYITNFTSGLLFHYIYLTYIYIYNDISPTKNKYFFSVTDPIHHVLYFLRFFLYNLLLIATNYTSNHFIFVLIIIVYLSITFQFAMRKVYFIHRNYYYLVIANSTFFTISLFLNLIFSSLRLNIFMNKYYILIISIIITAISIPVFNDFRSTHLFGFNNLNENIFNEIYLYHLLTKKRLNHNDILEHKKICSLFPMEKCMCKSPDIFDISNSELNREIKLKTCLLISKIYKSLNNIDQIYIKIVLDNNKLHESLFQFYFNFPAKKIPIYKQHLVFRNLNKFNGLFIDFYNTCQQNLNQKIKIENIIDIIKYEEIFRCFLKNIKKTKNLFLKFWDVIKNKPIIKADFFNYGMEISSKVINISQDFGKMQKIHLNKLNLLKIYAHFVKAIIHDEQYVDYLVNLIKENTQMIKSKNNNLSNYNDKEFGILVISGEPKNLFRILSYNKFSKQFFSDTVTLKNEEIHTLLPFPFSIVHKTYLKHNFNNNFLSKERSLFCNDHNGHLKFINANIIPIINFRGNITFIMLFYMPKENKNSMIAYVDKSGFIFASTKKFKEEFEINNDYSIKKNSKILQGFSKMITNKNIQSFNYIKISKKELKSDLCHPKIYDLINETKRFFKGKRTESFRCVKKYSKNIETQDENNINDFVIDSSSIHDILLTRTFFTSKKTQLSYSNILLKGKTKEENAKNQTKPYTYKPSFSKSDKEVSIFLSNSINTLEFRKNKQKYRLEIKENNTLSGLFSYYSVDLKLLNRESFKVSYKTATEFRMKQNNYLLNKNTINNTKNSYINNYQIETKFFSRSKIFKKLYYYNALIFTILTIMSVYIAWFNLNEYSYYTRNCDVFNGFLFIENKLVLMLLNVEYLTYYQYISNINISNTIEEKINYSKNSLQYDITSIENSLQDFIKKDLSASSQVKDTIQSQSLQLSHLSYNYHVSFNNYTLYQALDLYLVEIKIFLNNEIEKINYFVDNNSNNSNPIEYERSLFFLNENYFNSIRYVLERLINDKVEVLQEDINRNSVLFNIQNIIFCAVFTLLLLLLFILLRDIYIIDTSLICFYSRLDDMYIENSFINLKLSFFLPEDNEFDEKTFLKTNKSIRRIYYKEDETNIDEIILKKKNSSNQSEKITITTQELNSEENLINMNQHNSLFKAPNNIHRKSINESNSSNMIDIKHLYKVGIYKNFYLKKFIKAMLLVVSLSYFYIIQVFIHPHSSYSVENFLVHQYTLHKKIIFNNLLIQILLESIRSNSTKYDNNKIEMFEFYYNKILEVNHNYSNLPKEKYFYNNEIRGKINIYNSLNFCGFFFNSSFTEKTILMPEESYDNCIPSPIYFGIDVYLSQMKKSISTIYNSFKNIKVRDSYNLMQLINKKSIIFAHLDLGFYLRIYRDDTYTSFSDSLNNIIDFCNFLIKVSLISFIVQLCIFSLIMYFLYSKKLHFHFEKKRILFSILPRDDKTNITIQINNLLNVYF